jgi:transposase
VEALCVLLHNNYHIALERVSRLLGDLFSHPVNAATILSAQHRAYDRLAASEAVIQEALLSSAALNVDETGLRAAGKLHWLHGASSSQLSYFFVHPKRGKDALWSEASLLPSYRGRMIHDCFASYFKFEQADHGLCGAHLLRELEALGQDEGSWAAAMRSLLLEAYWQVSQEGRLDRANYYRYKRRYFEILRQGLEEHLPYVTIGIHPGRKKRGKARSLIRRLVRYHKAVWAFALDEAVPFTNNQAERDIRMVKLKQKINGGFRTKAGADAFARIAGFCSTVRKQGQSVFAELKRAMQQSQYAIGLSSQ